MTVKCKRIVVWFHRISKSYRYSWIFHGRKGFDFTPTSNPKPKVIRDYCSVSSLTISFLPYITLNCRVLPGDQRLNTFFKTTSEAFAVSRQLQRKRIKKSGVEKMLERVLFVVVVQLKAFLRFPQRQLPF